MLKRFHRGIALYLLLIVAFVIGTAGSSPPKSTFRVHVETPVKTAGGTQCLPVTLINPAKQIIIRAMPELSERDIAKVESTDADIGVALRITFNQHGTTVLNAVTMEQQGKILVVFLNGRIVYAPIIDKTISDGTLIIPRGVMAEEVELLSLAAKKSRE